MRPIDGDALQEAFYQKMKELLKSTYTPQISNEALSLLCGASLITEAMTIEPEDRCGECDAWNQYKNYSRRSQWIPCSERLPAYGEDVLISIGGYCNVGRVVPVNEEEQYNWYFSGWYHLPNDVDAWMPLPEPYREEGD